MMLMTYFHNRIQEYSCVKENPAFVIVMIYYQQMAEAFLDMRDLCLSGKGFVVCTKIRI